MSHEADGGFPVNDPFWDEFCRNWEANKCPWCKGQGRVGLFACNACGATGQKRALSNGSRHRPCRTT